MTRPIRVGIVGANAERGWAKDAHLAALQSLPAYTIAAVSARTQPVADAAAALFGAPGAFADTLAMVRDPGIDLVAVTVKVPEHRAVVLAALAAGKHVYCEWPLGRDLDEAVEMAAAVRPERHVMIGLQGLSAPAVRHAGDLIRQGHIGAPRIIRVFGSAAAWGPTTPAGNAYLQDSRNGATLETIGGGHALAVVEALVGRFVEVDARSTTFQKTVPVEGTADMVARTCADHMLLLGLHATGCVSTFEAIGGRSDKPACFEVIGERGWIRVVGTVPGTCQIPRLTIESSETLSAVPSAIAPQLSGPPINLVEAYERLAIDIHAGRRTVPDFDTAVRLTRLLDAIGAASVTGARQSLMG